MNVSSKLDILTLNKLKMKFAIALVFCFATAYCVDVLNAPTPAPHDFRNDYDRLLIVFTQDHIKRVEEGLIRLGHQFTELEQTKDKDLKAKIITELDEFIPLLNGAAVYLDRELKRTDLDLIETFIFQSTRDDVGLLIKQLTALEVKVKAIA